MWGKSRKRRTDLEAREKKCHRILVLPNPKVRMLFFLQGTKPQAPGVSKASFKDGTLWQLYHRADRRETKSF